MTVARLLLGVLLATGLYAALLAAVPSVGQAIDPFLVVVVWFALARPPLGAMTAGMLVGLCHDVFSGRPFGLHGFADTVVGYLVARFAEQFLVRQPRALALVFGLSVAVQQALIAALQLLLVPFAEVAGPAHVAARVGASTLLGLLWVRAEELLRGRVASWRRSRASRLRLG